MNELEKIEWQMPEYETKEKNNDWFWALGIVVVAGAATSVIFSNYFFAILIVLSGILIFIFSVKPPEMVNCELNHKGLKIRDRIYLYKDIASFWVQKENPPTLFVKTRRIIMPVISVPIDLSFADDVKKAMLTSGVTQEEMKAHFSEKVMDSIGF